MLQDKDGGMIDYFHTLEYYAFKSTKNISSQYLSKFWLDRKEVINFVLPIKRKIFNGSSFNDSENSNLHFFTDSFSSFITKGGVLFEEKSFIQVSKLSQAVDEKFFYVLEDFFGNEEDFYRPEPALRFKYENKISWEEINIKDEGISYQLFGRPVRNYFILGDSGKWGKYVANDYIWPLELTGYCKNIKHVIRQNVRIPKQEKKDLLKWRPEKKEYFCDGWNLLNLD